ncbi:hypothetical protein, partial [Limnobacter sp. UBA3528]|uniref:hypothetical protein n=1 Tax=Limnobacter sp. UBA3528 TaxID=1946760 RepID=UPI0025B83E79
EASIYGKTDGRVSVSACSRPLRIHSNGAVFLKCAPSNPTAELAQSAAVSRSACLQENLPV